MNAAFSYLSEIGAKNESDIYIYKKKGENPANCAQSYSEASLIRFSTLDSQRKSSKNGRGEWRREEEEGGSCSVGRSVG